MNSLIDCIMLERSRTKPDYTYISVLISSFQKFNTQNIQLNYYIFKDLIFLISDTLDILIAKFDYELLTLTTQLLDSILSVCE